MKKLIFIAVLGSLSLACGPAANKNVSAPTVAATPQPTASVPVNGDYPARGKVTKINTKDGSVELDHEEIKGVMPAMKMEFFVIDSAILKGLAVGDEVSFVLRYKDGQEIVTEIAKQK
jgi:Cu/Ag efflux protein CusF